MKTRYQTGCPGSFPPTSSILAADKAALQRHGARMRLIDSESSAKDACAAKKL